MHAVTHRAEIRAYINLQTRDSVPVHLLGSAADGRPLYQAVDGHEPDAAYEFDDDGNWLPLQVTFQCVPAAAHMLPVDLKAVHAQDGGDVYQVLVFGVDGYEQTAQRGSMLWLDDAGRGGVDFGGGAVWTDARSPEDAVRRVLLGEVVA